MVRKSLQQQLLKSCYWAYRALVGCSCVMQRLLMWLAIVLLLGSPYLLWAVFDERFGTFLLGLAGIFTAYGFMKLSQWLEKVDPRLQGKAGDLLQRLKP